MIVVHKQIHKPIEDRQINAAGTRARLFKYSETVHGPEIYDFHG
jgi:hypothetical protein